MTSTIKLKIEQYFFMLTSSNLARLKVFGPVVVLPVGQISTNPITVFASRVCASAREKSFKNLARMDAAIILYGISQYGY